MRVLKPFQSKIFALLLGACIVSLSSLLFLNRSEKNSNHSLTVFQRQKPHSIDPLESDLTSHAVTFSSLFSNLTTRFTQDGINPEVADHWIINSENTKAEFFIRPGLTYENGDEITPLRVSQSLARSAFVMKKKKSRSDLFDRLLVRHPETHTPQHHSGIEATATSIILHFRIPTLRIAEALSQRWFSIVHPNDFDTLTGDWKNSHQATASGPYRLAQWTSNELSIEHRKDTAFYPINDKSIHSLTFFSDPNRMLDADIISHLSILDIPSDEWHFHGGIANGIVFMRCLAWAEKQSPFSNRNFRIGLRHQFYQKLKKLGFPAGSTFLPPALGMEPLPEPNEIPSPEAFHGSSVLGDVGTMSPLGKAANAAIFHVLEKLNPETKKIQLESKEFFREFDPHTQSRKSDFLVMSTNVHIEDPAHDVRFMFQSKEGIRLPDEDGSILPLLEHANENLGLINRKIWEQAIIWPIGHISFGFWSRGRVDFSHVNLFTSGTYFSTWRLL